MSTFRTTLPLTDYTFTIDHQSSILSIGSCFAENIALRLLSSKFTTSINPFGILYHPLSIADALQFILDNYSFSEKNLIQSGDLWHSFFHHSAFSGTSSSSVLAAINHSIKTNNTFLKKANRLIITFGTSNAFRYKETGQIVANCHKIPNPNFERITLSIDQIVKRLNPIFKLLKTQNPALEILLTVSPVRHIRDGLIENQKSKARLLLASEILSEANNFVHYFPSYELLLDDLRDYRFYTEDLLHPNSTAIDYIWDYFSTSFFTEKTQNLNATIKKINMAVQHRPFHPTSNEHQVFLKTQLQNIEQLRIKYPFLNFNQEASIFEAQIT